MVISIAFSPQFTTAFGLSLLTKFQNNTKQALAAEQ